MHFHVERIVEELIEIRRHPPTGYDPPRLRIGVEDHPEGVVSRSLAKHSTEAIENIGR